MKPVQSCDAHQFEATIQLTGRDGNPRQTKVRMCGVVGQSDADWIGTLKDAVKKTELNPAMPEAVKVQIIAAVSGEIARLSTPSLNLARRPDLSTLARPTAPPADRPLSRDFAALPPLATGPVAEPPHLLDRGGVGAVVRLTLRCAIIGDEDRPGTCDEINKDTVLVVRSDQSFPRGLDLRFDRKGQNRAELNLPAMTVGQTTQLKLPPAVCAGVVRSRVEIMALPANSAAGTAPSSIGEYDLRC